MIKIHVTLHSYLREKLPPELNGHAEFDLPDGASIRDVILVLDIPDHVICALNDQIEQDRERLLKDGDHLRFLRPGAGGSLDQ